MRQVRIVHRGHVWQQLENLRIEGIFKSEENANRFARWAVDNWDSKFEVVTQRWLLDDSFLDDTGKLDIPDNWRELKI